MTTSSEIIGPSSLTNNVAGPTSWIVGGFSSVIVIFASWLRSGTIQGEKTLEELGSIEILYLMKNTVVNIFSGGANFLSNVFSIFSHLTRLVILFFYIFCILIVLGRFDWLLDDIYALGSIALVLTYLSTR